MPVRSMWATAATPRRVSRPPVSFSPAPSANFVRRFHVNDAMRTPSRKNASRTARSAADRLHALEREHERDAAAAR